MSASRFTFPTLILIVAIAGMSQGLTLPLLSILLERAGVSAVANGFNAAALYIGILLISPLLEIPLRRFGYRNTIFCGLALVSLCTLLFPLIQSYTVWFLLRMLLGIGDSALHYASQMWVTALAPAERRGRDISLYGFAYGAGFSIGPLGMLLLPFGVWAPFLAICAFYLIAFVMLGRLSNDWPEAAVQPEKRENKYAAVIRAGWLALLPSFLFGFMEASLNVNFPVYAVRSGMSLQQVSVMLPAFVIGSLALQLPLGKWSDRVGRQKVMMACAGIGAAAFIGFPFTAGNVWGMSVLLAVAGASVGSFYSLGLAFAADILPPNMVPTAGIIAGMNFSIASIVAPNLNGYLIGSWWPGSMFLAIGTMLAGFAVAGCFFRRQSHASMVTHRHSA